jgi:hypothetical protein
LYRIKSRDESEKTLKAEHGKLVSAVYKHEHWVDDRIRQILGETVDPGPSPMETIDLITPGYFPAFIERARALRDTSKALEDWIAMELLAQSEEGCDKARGTYEKALHDFLTELREFGEKEFGSRSTWWRRLFPRRI